MHSLKLNKINPCNLSVIPRTPISSFNDCYRESDLNGLSKSVREEVLRLEKTRVDVMKENSSIFFNNKFLKAYERHFGNFDNLDVLGPIFRIFGFDLNNVSYGYEPRLKILQIGCGPWEVYKRGPKLDKILASYGAKVVNLDVNEDVRDNYKESIFVPGSWFELDSVLPKNMGSFDVIFVDNMNPYQMDDEVTKLRQPFETMEMVYMKLFSQTVSKLTVDGVFYVSGVCDQNFGFPEYVCDNVYNHKTSYTHLICDKFSTGIQFFQRKGF